MQVSNNNSINFGTSFNLKAASMDILPQAAELALKKDCKYVPHSPTKGSLYTGPEAEMHQILDLISNKNMTVPTIREKSLNLMSLMMDYLAGNKHVVNNDFDVYEAATKLHNNSIDAGVNKKTLAAIAKGLKAQLEMIFDANGESIEVKTISDVVNLMD